MVRSLSLAWFLGLASLPCHAFSALQADDERPLIQLPADIQRILQKNGEDLSPLTISWTCQRSLLAVGRSDVQKRFPKIDPGFWKETKTDYRFDRGCYHHLYHFSTATIDTTQGFLDPDSMFIESSFDGQHYFAAFPRADLSKAPAGLLIEPLDRLRASNDRESPTLFCDYFRFAGFVLPNYYPEHGPDHASSRLLELLVHDGRLLQVTQKRFQSIDCLRVRMWTPGGDFEFYLDSARGYAIVHFQERDQEGKIVRMATMSDFSKVLKTEALWLPRTCIVSHYVRPEFGAIHTTGVPLLMERYQVTDMRRDPVSPKAFTMNYAQQGMTIADRTLTDLPLVEDARVSYVIPCGQHELDKVIDEYVARQSSSWPASANRWIPKGLILLNVTVIVALILYQLQARHWAQK